MAEFQEMERATQNLKGNGGFHVKSEVAIYITVIAFLSGFYAPRPRSIQ